MPLNKFQPDSQYPAAAGARAATLKTAQAARRRLDEINRVKERQMKFRPDTTPPAAAKSNGGPPTLEVRVAAALDPAAAPPSAASLVALLDAVWT